MGPDGIIPKVLKACAGSLSGPMAVLFNTCLKTCSLPDIWKNHKITPIPKSGNTCLISNYRPISLLCVMSKVLETVIYGKIIDFIRPSLTSNQYGFLSNRSSTVQLLSCYSEIIGAMDSKLPVDVLYLDLRKAFDSVSHNELLFKLWHVGITGHLWLWFKAYLMGRHHYVYYEGCVSSSLPVLSGVPQGSVLGPLLFLIYVNDIPTSVNYSSVYLFADDTKLLKVLHSNADTINLQEDMDSLDHWCTAWQISLNVLKCSHLTFSLSQREQTSTNIYSSNGSVIKHASTYKDLGIKICRNLSWTDHVRAICSKAYGSLHVLKRSLPYTTNAGLKKRLYLSLVRSHLSYCSQLWRPFLVKDVRSLEKVQRRATKFILCDYTTSYKNRLLALDLLPISLWLEQLRPVARNFKRGAHN